MPSGTSSTPPGPTRTPSRPSCCTGSSAATLPDELAEALPTFDADAKGVATRSASGKVINALAPVLPELWGGSADLAGSNNTTITSAPSFGPEVAEIGEWSTDPYAGRVLHFGIREHGMGAIMNGIAADRLTRVFGGTFLTFSDYMRGSVRVAALSKLPVTYVWTHDSIGLGEDGPTHQPIEHLAALRAMPGLDVVRPADANETVAAWQAILGHTDRPAALALTRQNVPVFPRGEDADSGQTCGSTEGVARGAYVLLDADKGTPDVILIGTGSEVQLAVEARALLAEDGIDARVVSMPCLEWFEEQDAVLPRHRPAPHRQGTRLGRGRRQAGLARDRRRPRPDRLHRPLRRVRRLRPDLHRVRHHRRRPSPTPPATASPSSNA